MDFDSSLLITGLLMTAFLKRMKFEHRLAEKIPWRRKWQPTPVFLLGESPGAELGGLLSMG